MLAYKDLNSLEAVSIFAEHGLSFFGHVPA